jgi:hypothetical protein
MKADTMTFRMPLVDMAGCLVRLMEKRVAGFEFPGHDENSPIICELRIQPQSAWEKPEQITGGNGDE